MNFPAPSPGIAGLLKKNPVVFCGFSGGADSTYLLLSLLEWSQAFKFTLKAVHFEHGLRGKESLADAAWCRKICRRFKIPLKIITLNVPENSKSGESVETAARRLRLDSLTKLAEENIRSIVALGHNADDRTENLFLRLARGSNSSGLVSMRETGRLGQVTIIRPLLKLGAGEIRASLAEFLPDFRVDSSNLESEYKRNFLRNQILPSIYKEMPFAEEGFKHAVSALEDDSDFIENSGSDAFEKFLADGEKISFLAELHDAVLIRVLRRWFYLRCGKEIIPSFRLMERLKKELCAKVSKPRLIPLDGELFIKMAKGKLKILSKAQDSFLNGSWNWKEIPEFKNTEFGWRIVIEKAQKLEKLSMKGHLAAAFDAAELPDTLTVRFRQDGDTMIPFGRKNPEKLKKLFSDAGINAEQKSTYPLLCTSEGKILWIAGLRESDSFKVSSKTRHILIFKFLRDC